MNERAIVRSALQVIYNDAPHRTNNLRRNALKMEMVAPHHWRIYVDQNIAPYMPYTNEPWISPRWNGKENPNEKWWERRTEEALRHVAALLQGEIKREK